MGVSAEEDGAHSDESHGLGDLEALFVIADETAPARHPSEGAFDGPAAWQDLEARVFVAPADDFDSKIEEGGFVHELEPIIGAISEQMFHPGQRLRMLFRMVWAPAESEISAGVRLTMSRRPSVSTAMWRLRPRTFLPAS